jgi:predicted SAM-dependent methyltransferase
MEIPANGLRLNVGCGGRRLPGYTGVDVIPRPAADIVSPADAIPLPSNSVEEILAIHVVEHVHQWEVPSLLKEWFRLLKPGGRLVMEMPDIIKCAKNVAEGYTYAGKHPDQAGMWGIFGDSRLKDPYMIHKWGWHFKSLSPLVKEAGFVKLKEERTQFHPVGRERRDFRMEAIKP